MALQAPIQAITDEKYTQYIAFTRTTAKYPSFLTGNRDELAYLCLGLYNEFCEYLEAVACSLPAVDRWSELSDVCWYLFRLFDALAFDNPWFTPLTTGPGPTDKVFITASGGIAGICKKVLRDNSDVHGETEKREKMRMYLTNCLQAVTRLAHNEGISVKKLLEINQHKLQSRVERGTLCGDGDHR